MRLVDFQCSSCIRLPCTTLAFFVDKYTCYEPYRELQPRSFHDYVVDALSPIKYGFEWHDGRFLKEHFQPRLIPRFLLCPSLHFRPEDCPDGPLSSDHAKILREAPGNGINRKTTEKNVIARPSTRKIRGGKPRAQRDPRHASESARGELERIVPSDRSRDCILNLRPIPISFSGIAAFETGHQT